MVTGTGNIDSKLCPKYESSDRFGFQLVNFCCLFFLNISDLSFDVRG